MRFTSYSFTFIFIFCFVLLLCTALQAELVKSYDSDKDMTTINTKPTQIMNLDPWKQPRLSLTIQHRGRNKPSPWDLSALKVKMSFISLSRERKFDNYKVIQFYAGGSLVFQRKFELDTDVRKGSVMETLTVIVSYCEFEKMIDMIPPFPGSKTAPTFRICKKDEIDKLGECIELKFHEKERLDIQKPPDLLR